MKQPEVAEREFVTRGFPLIAERFAIDGLFFDEDFVFLFMV